MKLYTVDQNCVVGITDSQGFHSFKLGNKFVFSENEIAGRNLEEDTTTVKRGRFVVYVKTSDIRVIPVLPL